MPGSERPVVIQLEQQVEIGIFLVSLTDAPLNEGLFMVVKSDRFGEILDASTGTSCG